MNELVSIDAAAALIRGGAALSVAGPEAALDRLPAGRWIGGTIPYFMVADGGCVVTDDRVFVSDLTHLGEVQVARYDAAALEGIVSNAPANGFSLVIIPAGSPAHDAFAQQAPTYADAFLKPTVGWISGVHLSELGRTKPKIYDGRTATKLDDGAVVAYVDLPGDQLVSVEIVNLFEPGGGDLLRFDETGAHVTRCLVNGVPTDFAPYLREHGLADGKLPLVGDFAGAHVNVSIQGLDEDGGVTLYAPVFPGVDYHFAAPVPDYVEAFRSKLAAKETTGLVLGCNCILNFVHGELEGKAIGGIEGPITFGEIAYQLLNQTLVTLRIV
jgi:hypothetical protein